MERGLEWRSAEAEKVGDASSWQTVAEGRRTRAEEPTLQLQQKFEVAEAAAFPMGVAIVVDYAWEVVVLDTVSRRKAWAGPSPSSLCGRRLAS